jgi:phage regulator Rha-like protein
VDLTFTDENEHVDPNEIGQKGMKTKHVGLADKPVDRCIQTIRSQRVILDTDLARVYGVPTRQLNQAVKRNLDRFPDDFAFELEPQEVAALRSQIVTSKKRGGRRYVLIAFTEHGAIMAANVLNSPRAAQMSVFVVRAFIKMRETLAQNRQLAEKLAELEKRLTDRLDVHEKAIVHILDEIKKLMAPLPPEPETKRREIGFHARDEAGTKLCSSRGDEAQIPGTSNAGPNRVRASSRRLLRI